MKIDKRILPHIETEESLFFYSSLPALLIQSSLNYTQFKKLNTKPFLQFLNRHRMIPVFFNGLSNHIQDIREDAVFLALKKQYAHYSGRTLLLSAEMVKLSKVFQANNIPFFFLKGPVLAHVLYGENSVRQSVDVDVYTHSSHLTQSRKLLMGLDYIHADKNSGQLYRIKQYSQKDLLYKHVKHSVQLELHHRFLFNKYHDRLFAEKCPPPIKFNFRGTIVYTLPHDWHFLYLVAHGTYHQYFRFFWLHDIAVFIRSGKISDWNKVQKQAASTDLLLHLYLTLRLVKIFYQTEIQGFVPGDTYLYNKSERLLNTVIQAIMNPVDETLTRRLKRLLFFLTLSNHPVYRWHVLSGGLLRFFGW